MNLLEELLRELLEGQQRTERQLSLIREDIQSIKTSVEHIETHQEETIMSMLVHIHKQVELKENQIQVLNKRLFQVETKTEQIQ